MQTLVIVNPNAGSGDEFARIRRRLSERRGTLVRETLRPGDGAALAREAASGGATRIVAVGGDGTVNEVVNGIMTSPLELRERVTLAIIPLGTGNDLPRTLDIPLDADDAIELLKQATPCTAVIDLIKVRFGDTELYGVNVAAGGFTGQMNEVMTDEIKQTWGPLAYLRGAVSVLPNLTQYHTTIVYDGNTQQRISALNVIVANGRTAGGGTVVAPGADPQDGLLDIVIVGYGTTLELTGVAARVLAGDYTNSDIVTHRRAKRVHVESHPGMWFGMDGELLTNEPITFSVTPRAVRVIVGPNYSP